MPSLASLWLSGCWVDVGLLALSVVTSPAQTLSLLGLALSFGPFDYTHGLWPFFLIPLEGLRGCDSCVFPGAQSEDFQPVSHQGTEGGGVDAGAAQTVCAGGQDDKTVKTWWLRSPKVTGGSPKAPCAADKGPLLHST